MVIFAPLNVIIMNNPIEPFHLPTLGELKKLNEQQIKGVLYLLEEHRAKELLSASYDFNDRIDAIEKDYASDFQVLANALAEARKK